MRVRSYLHGVVLGHGRRHGSAHFGHRDLLRGHLRARLDLALLPVRRGRHRAELQTATDRRGSAGGREPHRRRHRGGPARAGRPEGRSRDRRHPGRRERRGEHLARLVRVRVSRRARVHNPITCGVFRAKTTFSRAVIGQLARTCGSWRDLAGRFFCERFSHLILAAAVLESQTWCFFSGCAFCRERSA